MRSLKAPIFLALLLLVFPAAAFAQTYSVNLLGTNETSNCDPDGTGSATVVFNGTLVSYTITVANIAPPTAQHIHIGAAGVDGGVVIGLPGTWSGNTLAGSTTGDPGVIAAIHASPAGHYLNVHNGPCPGGAVRGQLVFQSASTSIPTFSGGILLLMVAVLGVAGLIALKR